MDTASSINTKAEMYRLLSSGVLGNTVPQWFSVVDWINDTVKTNGTCRHEWWGVRTLTPGGPCKLNCHWRDVVNYAVRYRQLGHRYNISPMIDRITRVTMWANIWDSPTGLVVECIEYPPKEGSWRELMPTYAKSYSGIRALCLLRRHLNQNSLEDLYILLERYPSHVVELSALETCIGTVPGRNAVIWEVRNY